MLDPNANAVGGLKIGYSRGMPTYLAPNLFTHKKQEEYFVTNLYAQALIYNNFHVTGVLVCDDDSNKGADAIIKTLGSPDITVQITRFTLTNYLLRRKSAEKRVDYIISKILQLGSFEVPVNVIIYPIEMYTALPINKQKNDNILAERIHALINENIDKLSLRDGSFINHSIPPKDDPLSHITHHISLQSIPEGFHSNYFGRDKLYINYDFDNIYFTQEDIDLESNSIFEKKNNGTSSVLLIWADFYEILYTPDRIVASLTKKFIESSFEQIFFLSFYTKKPHFMENPVHISQIK
ncbi:hypothetical protein [Chitinophaga sp. 212800010-3]|uniref:hypothetical protein n=1 Tax=unclassified Chitinophaga TaxID=2619133 RepID=UPI002DF4377D|nr:hypothetical protein [Chitinophaga sp. 212800010-3]